MVIHDLDLVGVAVLLLKANSPLIVDSDAVLMLPISQQPFEPVAWDRRQFCEVGNCIEHDQLPQSGTLDGSEPPASVQQEQPFSLRRAEGLDHVPRLYCLSLSVNQ
jgi:hypothetical protein